MCSSDLVLAIKHHDNANETIQKEILVGGSFTQYNGTLSSKLVVLKDNRTTTAENGTIQVNQYACVPSDLGFNGDVYAIEQTATNVSSNNEDYFLIGGNFTTYTTKRVIGFRAASVNALGTAFAVYNISGSTNNDQTVVASIEDPNSYSFQNPPFTSYKLYDTSSNFSNGAWANQYINGNVSFTVGCSYNNNLAWQLGIQLWYSVNNFTTESKIWEKRITPASTGSINETFSISIAPGAYYRIKVFQKSYNPNATTNFTNITWYLNTPSTMPATQTVVETLTANRILGAVMYNEYFGRVLTPLTFSGAGANGPVRAIQRISNSVALIGGNFTTYNGGDYKYVVAIDTGDGSVINTWTDPDLNGEVYSITQGPTPSGAGTYISGSFSFAGNTFYGGVLKIDPLTGVVDTNFVPALTGSNIIGFGIGDDSTFELVSATYNADDVGPAPTTMYWYIEDRHYSDFWKSDVHNVGRYRLEDPNVKTVHRKASAIHSDSLIFGTQVNGLSSFGLDNQNIVDLNPVHGEIVRAITSGREGKTLKCLQPNKENSIYIQFYPNEVGDTSNLRVSDKTFSTWFDYKSLFGTTEPGGVALLPDGTTIYFDPTRGAFVYSD